jgi:hypothetical protein
MAWKAKTLAKTLMTVALEITFGILSATTDRFGYAKAHKLIFSSYIIRERYTNDVFSILNVARYLKVTISSARRSTLLPDR